MRVCDGLWTRTRPRGLTNHVSITLSEITSQPETWRTALARHEQLAGLLPPKGSSVLYLGCGTSAFVARAAAHLREGAGHGPTDWAFASELIPRRTYDHVIALTRSGTTTEVLDALAGHRLGRFQTVVTGVRTALPDGVADAVVDLGFADEASVVQTRFPTTLLIVLRKLLGEDMEPVVKELDLALDSPVPVNVGDFDHYVYLARGWALGLADEAALKMREAAQAWAESCPAMDYRHGPIAAADARTLVAPLSALDEHLVRDIESVGATVIDLANDPLVRLVQCQRLAVALAEHRNLNPDQPRHLTRSVVLAEHANTA